MKIDDIKTTEIRFWPVFSVATVIALLSAVEELVDEIITGNLFDDVAFSAFNILEPYQWSITLLIYLMIVGSASLSVRALGKGDKERASQIFSHGLTCCLSIGVLFFLVYTLFSEQMVTLVAGQSEIRPYALEIVEVQAFTYLILPCHYYFNVCVLYFGGITYSYINVFVVTATNLILSILLGQEFGVVGVALATTIANTVGLIVLLAFFIKKENRLRFRPRFEFPLAKKILGLGLGESSMFTSMIILEYVVNTIALNRFGVQGVAVVSLVVDCFFAVAYISEGISEFETISMNTYIGQKRQDRFDAIIKKVIKVAILEGAVFSLLYFTLAPFIPEGFGIDSEETAVIAADCLKLLAIAPIFICIIRITSIFFQYTNRISRCIYGFLFAFGVYPALCFIPFCWLSLSLSAIGVVLGPIITFLTIYLFCKFVKKEDMFKIDISQI